MKQTRLTDAPGLAKYLSIKLSKVRNLVYFREIPGIIKIGRLVRFNLNTIDEWLLNQENLIAHDSGCERKKNKAKEKKRRSSRDYLDKKKSTYYAKEYGKIGKTLFDIKKETKKLRERKERLL